MYKEIILQSLYFMRLCNHFNIETDVDQFKSAGFVYAINLIPYYKVKLRNFITSEKRTFKNNLYNKAFKDEGLQGSFLDTVRRFENYEIQKYENSICFDGEKFVREVFGIWSNYELLNPVKLFEDDISNVQLMIYFISQRNLELG